MNKKSVKVFLIFILLLSIPLLIWGGLRLAHHLKWKAEGRKSWRTQHALEAAWATNNFTTANDPGELTKLIRAQLDNQANPLEDLKADRLAEKLSKMFAAFSSGSFDQFADFRFPAPYTNNEMWQADMMSFARQALQYHHITPTNTGDLYSDNMQVSRQFFDWASTLIDEHGHKRYCTSCWDGLAVSSIKVMPEESKSDRTGLMGMAQSEGVINFSHPAFFVNSSVHPIMPYGETISYANVRLVVQTSGMLKAYAVYISFFWDPKTNQWFPYEMILPVMGDEVETLLY